MSATASTTRPTEAQSEWARRVLGVAPRGAGQTASTPLIGDFQAALAGLVGALAAVDKQMATLKTALLRTGDDDFSDIAESCLDDVVGDEPRKLAGALDRIGRGGESALREAAGETLPMLADALRAIESSEAVSVCEANPLAVPLTIRATLRPAMSRLQSVIARAAG